jgi:hypothetical protein
MARRPSPWSDNVARLVMVAAWVWGVAAATQHGWLWTAVSFFFPPVAWVFCALWIMP